jgi:hypothetical protein
VLPCDVWRVVAPSARSLLTVICVVSCQEAHVQAQKQRVQDEVLKRMTSLLSAKARLQLTRDSGRSLTFWLPLPAFSGWSERG